MYQYFLKIGNTDYMSEWKPKGLSDEVIKPPTIFDNSVLHDEAILVIKQE